MSSNLEVSLFGRVWRWSGWTATGVFIAIIYGTVALAFIAGFGAGFTMGATN